MSKTAEEWACELREPGYPSATRCVEVIAAAMRAEYARGLEDAARTVENSEIVEGRNTTYAPTYAQLGDAWATRRAAAEAVYALAARAGKEDGSK